MKISKKKILSYYLKNDAVRENFNEKFILRENLEDFKKAIEKIRNFKISTHCVSLSILKDRRRAVVRENLSESEKFFRRFCAEKNINAEQGNRLIEKIGKLSSWQHGREYNMDYELHKDGGIDSEYPYSGQWSNKSRNKMVCGIKFENHKKLIFSYPTKNNKKNPCVKTGKISLLGLPKKIFEQEEKAFLADTLLAQKGKIYSIKDGKIGKTSEYKKIFIEGEEKFLFENENIFRRLISQNGKIFYYEHGKNQEKILEEHKKKMGLLSQARVRTLHDSSLQKIKKTAEKIINPKINFSTMRELGACEVGIRSFCERYKLRLEENYDFKFLKKFEEFKSYKDQIVKKFAENFISKKLQFFQKAA